VTGLAFDGAYEARGIAVLRGLADGRQTDPDPYVTPRLNRRDRSMWDSLVGVVQLGPLLRQGPTQPGTFSVGSKWRLRCQPPRVKG
jgi:hypothetical protein